jgi:hypothetical protein
MDYGSSECGPPIIGLSGYARSGKDTVAAILARHGYQRAAFADKIREALYLLNPSIQAPGFARSASVRSIVDAIGWETAKDDCPDIRALLQRLGSDMAHPIFGADCWVRIGLAAIDGLTVFTDCRFPLEANQIQERGGVMWRINRPGCAPVNAHVSETALDSFAFDRVIDNDGDLDDLRRTVEAAVTPMWHPDPVRIKSELENALDLHARYSIGRWQDYPEGDDHLIRGTD